MTRIFRISRISRISGVLTAILFSCRTLSGQAPAVRPTFDAADIYLRPHDASAIPSMTAPMLRGGRYDVRNATLLDLIKTAYGTPKEKILGGPSWLDWNRFDVVAKAPAETPPATIALMLQSLLAERFTLAIHTDTKPVPGYALLPGSGRPKLREATTPSAAGGCDALPNQQTGTAIIAGITCHAVTMESFAGILLTKAGAYLSGDLVDLTGLNGAWDFELRWTPKALLARAGADGISLTSALDRQLGLKLEARDVPSAVIVVDSVAERPSPNPSGVAETLPAPPPAEFDVADIKISPPDSPTVGRLQPGGRIDLQGMTMKTLIRLAWTLNDDELLAGGPKWLDDTKYSLVARSTSAIAGTAGAMQIDIDDLRLMLRALLVERFKLQTHFEDRPVSAYTLVSDKPKVRPADAANRTSCREGVLPGAKDPRDTNPMLSRLVTCQNITMAQFVEDLPRIAGGYIHVPVVDATGMSGAWDFTLNFSPAGQANGTAGNNGQGTATSPLGATVPTGGISLFDALEGQLGVKLEMRKRPMAVLVIDHVDAEPILQLMTHGILSGCRRAAHHAQTACPEPGRNRHPHHARGHRAGAAHRRHFSQGGRAQPPPVQGGRGVPDRRGQGTRRGVSRRRRASSRSRRRRASTRFIPGYGFLSENPALPRACAAAGITFVGPSAELLDVLGDKTAARRLAATAGVPIVPGVEHALSDASRDAPRGE